MADHANSTPAPAAHGPVSAAIRAIALEHEPARASFVPSALAPSQRPPAFAPLNFNFPLSDSLWGTVYLRPVRFAVEFTNLRGSEAVERVARARTLEGRYVDSTLGQLALAIVHLEELAELCRIARGRLIEADACAKLAEDRRTRQ